MIITLFNDEIRINTEDANEEIHMKNLLVRLQSMFHPTYIIWKYGMKITGKGEDDENL